MNTTGSRLRMAGVGWLVAAVALAGTASAANAPEMAMLGSLTKGSWNLRLRDDGSQRRICVRSGREFVQLRHTQPGCQSLVVKDTPQEVVVQYTCRGNGYGRTSIRRESNTLVQIQSQGIIEGAPFSISGEARHAGNC